MRLLTLGIVNGQYPLEECGGNVGGPLSQMSDAVNKIDNGSNQTSTVNGMGSSGSGLSNSNEMFSNNKVNSLISSLIFIEIFGMFLLLSEKNNY